MLKTVVAGIPLDSCIYNASGPRTATIEALAKIGESQSGAILSKSATLVKQDGNPLPRFVNKIDMGKILCEGSMNSEGLPNAGIDYYISETAIKTLSPLNKPYIISISGLSLSDNLEMFERIMKIEYISAIELNLACPNIPGKPVIAYDFDQMDDIISKFVSHPLFHTKPFGIKLAPYFDIPHFKRAADIIAKYPIKFVVTCNTIGNGLIVDYERECAAISPKGGFGGLGGGFIKPVALANVRMLSTLLSDSDHNRADIDIIGVGGVCSGQDAFELILCGASAVQVGTCHWTEGSSCFARIADELQEIMTKKGYSSINEFKGKLKPYQAKTIVSKAKEEDATNSFEIKDTKNKNSFSMFDFKTLLVIQSGIILALICAMIFQSQTFQFK